MTTDRQMKRDAGWPTLVADDGTGDVGRGHLFVFGVLNLDQGAGASNSAQMDWSGTLDPLRATEGQTPTTGKYRLRAESPHQSTDGRTGVQRELAQEIVVQVTDVRALTTAGEFIVTLSSVDGAGPETLIELGGE